MAEADVTRKLAAILYADVAEYSRLTGEDELGTHKQLGAALDLISDDIKGKGGSVVHYAGDAVLADFGSVVAAVNCAVAIQRQLSERNAEVPKNQRLQFRIGVNLGEVIVDRDDIYGDGVNIAARLETLAEPGGICVSGSVYEQVHKTIDLDFKDIGKREVKNIAEPIQAYAVRIGKPTSSAPASPPTGGKPSIAVLPFDNMSGDTNQEYFVDGITEDIITALSKNRWLSVIARNSTFAYKGKSPDVRRVADDLGVEYVVEGSVRKSGNRVRITAQLIDATSGKHIWAERYDRDLEDIFAVQDEITETITATIEPELGAFESKRVKNKPTENLGAWDCYHLGLSHLYEFSKDSNREAQRLFRRAIELDANFSAAHARLAYAIIMSAVYFDTEPTPELLDDALRAEQRAAKLDDQDALAHFAVGRAHLARSEYDLALPAMETSIELNPSLAQAHCGLGDALAYAGRLEESLSRFEEAIRLSPRDPYRWGFLMYGSLAQLFLKRHEAAADWARKAVSVPNSHYWANAALVAALGHLDRPDETRSAVEKLLQRKPEFTCSFAKKHLFYIENADQVNHYVDGLRKAGLPR